MISTVPSYQNTPLFSTTKPFFSSSLVSTVPFTIASSVGNPVHLPATVRPASSIQSSSRYFTPLSVTTTTPSHINPVMMAMPLRTSTLVFSPATPVTTGTSKFTSVLKPSYFIPEDNGSTLLSSMSPLSISDTKSQAIHKPINNFVISPTSSVGLGSVDHNALIPRLRRPSTHVTTGGMNIYY